MLTPQEVCICKCEVEPVSINPIGSGPDTYFTNEPDLLILLPQVGPNLLDVRPQIIPSWEVAVVQNVRR